MSDAARVPGGTITSLLGRYFPALARKSETSRRMNMRIMFELVRGGFLMLLVVLGSPPFGSELPLSGGPSPGSSDDAAAIAKAIGEFKDAYNQGDLEKTMGVFGDDLVYIGSGAPTRSGKDALDSWRSSLQDTFVHYDRALEIISEEIRVSGKIGIESFLASGAQAQPAQLTSPCARSEFQRFAPLVGNWDVEWTNRVA